MRAGLLTRRQLCSQGWRKFGHDVYADADLGDTHLVRCRAIGLVLPSGAAITGRSAACLDGLPIDQKDALVHVLAPLGTRLERPQCRVARTGWLPHGHIRPGSDPPVTASTRTAWEIASESDVVEAVVALDVLFRANRPRQEAMGSWVAAYPDSAAASAIALADGRSESPQESRARVRIVLEGFPPPTPQYEVVANGRFVARVDLAWPEVKVAVEYDGAWHAEPGQMAKDRARLNRLMDAGWTVLHLTSATLKHPSLFAAFCAQLRSALGV
ncbi:endonuclease domain-containing protein [Cryptosporangium minutisporangium]|uniref:endonuclease domain-containing protein n=1 Tax=Cryptosporangium minutisporangium TaxID=113569 RepID=UPI0031EA41E6